MVEKEAVEVGAEKREPTEKEGKDKMPKCGYRMAHTHNTQENGGQKEDMECLGILPMSIQINDHQTKLTKPKSCNQTVHNAKLRKPPEISVPPHCTTIEMPCPNKNNLLNLRLRGQQPPSSLSSANFL